VPRQTDRETELVRHAAEGDAVAFGQLYRRYRGRVYGFAYRMVGSQAIAEDVTQETFLVLIEHPDRYRPERASMLTFLCAIARNQIMYHLRRHRRDVEVDFESTTTVIEAPRETDRDPLQELLSEELSGEVNLAIGALPPLQREVIVLREFQELSYEEIATVTGVEVNVVKVRLYRARQSLARKLAPYLVSVGDQCRELC
jgi:RNA polymerase sigma-70 factor (ECF subfamily)